MTGGAARNYQSSREYLGIHQPGRCIRFPEGDGAGLQHKVIEAMFAARPVVGTQISNQGVGARPNEELFVGGTDAQIAEYVVQLS